jgi:hypothetical protein
MSLLWWPTPFRTRHGRVILLALVAVATAVLLILLGAYCLRRMQYRYLAGAPWTGTSARPGGWSQPQAEAFSDHPLYWLGPEYAGYHLTDIRPNGDRGVLFRYGACKPGFDPEARGCGPPLSIHVEHLCEIRGRPISSMPPTTARGGAVVQYGRPGFDGPLAAIATGRVRIVAYFYDKDNPIEAVQLVQQLRGLGMTAAIGPGGPLPPPDMSDC